MPMPRRRAAAGDAIVDRLAVEEDGAAVRPDDAGEHLHQRRFAGAVLADHRMDRAGRDVEAHVGDRHHAAVALGEVADGDERRVGSHGEKRGDRMAAPGSRFRSAAHSDSAAIAAGAAFSMSAVSFAVHGL